MPISRRTAPHASEGKTRPAHHAGLGHVRLPADYTGSPYHGGPLSDDSSCGRHSPRRRGPALRPSWPSPASRQTVVSLAAPKTVLYRTGSKASANAGVSHSAYRRSGCQHRVGHGHGSLDCDSKTVRDRPLFSLHLHRIAWQSLAFCGQDMPVKGNVQLFWDTIREAFPADLVGTPAFAHGVDELDAIRVDDAEYGRSGQEDLRPVLMRLEETKEPGALGEAGKQRPIVARQPAIEGPVAHAFKGMQQPQGDHLTGPEVGLGMFGDGAHLLIDLIEQRRDQIYRGHAALLSREGRHTDQRGGIVRRLQAQRCVP